MSEPNRIINLSNLSDDDIYFIRKNAMESVILCQKLIINYEKSERYDNVEIVEQIIKDNFRVLAAIANASEYSMLDNYLPKEFSLKQFFDDFVNICSSALRGTGISITCDCSPEIVVYADPDRLLACLLALVVNSAQNVDKDIGEIRLKASKLMDSVSIAIIDNGYGMDSNLIPKLLDYNTNKGGLAVVGKFCKIVGSQLITDTIPDGGFMASFRLPTVKNNGFSSSKPMFPITTFSPFNIYLSKISEAVIQFI